MVLRIDLLIYIYMALCACLLLFNLIYSGRRRISDIRSLHREQWWTAYLERIMLTDTEMPKPEIRQLTSRISNISGLQNFQETVEKMRIKENAAMVDVWFQTHRSAFVEIGSVFLKKDVMLKAYYAYVIWKNNLCGDSGQDAIVRNILKLVGEHSIYCRENALQAIYSGRNSGLVIKAYKIMQRYQIEHSQKLVTDGLASFAGDKEELAEAMWKEWDSFTPYYQTAFINFMRLTVGGFGQRLLPLLSADIDREVQFAVLRYLRRHHCDNAASMLRNMVKKWDVDDWEFPALAALALENYPSAKTVKALYEGMHSASWYVRNNASDSLIKIAERRKILNKVMQDGDRYAREMLEYKMGRRREDA